MQYEYRNILYSPSETSGAHHKVYYVMNENLLYSRNDEKEKLNCVLNNSKDNFTVKVKTHLGLEKRRTHLSEFHFHLLFFVGISF